MKDASPAPGLFRRFFSRKWLLRFAFALACLVTAVALFYTVVNWRGRHAWNAFVREWQPRGEQFALSAFVPPEVPPAQNFATTPFLAPLFDFVPGTQQWRDTNAVEKIKAFPPLYEVVIERLDHDARPPTNSWAKPAIDLRAWCAAYRQTNAGPPYIVPGSGTVLTNLSRAEAAVEVLQLLAETEPVFNELRQAATRPHARFALRYGHEPLPRLLLPHLAPLRRLTQSLQLRASANLALGREQAAFDDLQLMLTLSGSIQSEPLLISYLVRVATLQCFLSVLHEGLQQHQWTDAHLRTFEQQLGKLDLLADGKHVLRGERAFTIDFLDALRSSRMGLSSLDFLETAPPPEDWQKLLGAAIPDGWFYFEQVNFSRLFQQYALGAIDTGNRRVDPQLCRAGMDQIKAVGQESAARSFLRHEMFVRIFMPSFDNIVERIGLSQTGIDAARVACALERWRLVHGRYPETLPELQPEFIATLPRDVVSGNPLHYVVKNPAQFVLYSVGWNGQDDGGQIAYAKNRRSLKNEEGDWVWQ